MGETRVFVIDDNQVVLKSLCALLKAHRITADGFLSAEEFLNRYDGSGTDLLLLDVRMPGMSGLELQSELAARKLDPAIIFITAYGDIPMAVQAMRAGAIDFIEKPYSDDALLDSVRRGLEGLARGEKRAPPDPDVERRLSLLTDREKEVLDLLVLGHTSKMLARELDISPRTADIHRARVKEKMQARDLADLIRMTLP